MIMTRIFTIAALLLLVMPPFIARAMPIPGLGGEAFRDKIRLIQALRRCEAEAGEALEACLPTVSDEETIGDDELSESILTCEDEYQRAMTTCRGQLAQPRSVLQVGEKAGGFPN